MRRGEGEERENEKGWKGGVKEKKEGKREEGAKRRGRE